MPLFAAVIPTYGNHLVMHFVTCDWFINFLLVLINLLYRQICF